MVPNMEFPSEDVFRQRVRDAIQANGKSKIVAEKTGIPLGTLNKYVAMTSTASVENTHKIAKAFGLTVEELVAGKFDTQQGSETDENESASKHPDTSVKGSGTETLDQREDSAILAKLDFVVEQLAKLTAEKTAPAPARKAQPPRPATVTYLPFRASAGAGSVVLDDSPGDQLDIDEFSSRILRMNRRNMRLIEIIGDSMLPTFVSGDYVVADTSLPGSGDLPDNGKLYVILREGELLIKRAVWVDEEVLEWTSDNSYYQPIRLENEDIDQVKIVGKVRWLIRKAE
ncbi:phage repressor protein C with HTH and peptisase S24 domain [Agrobacterium larrymoorei]|uniref:Phage repressor protein C with HTH and peptisase S24 domain n=1 Tax=Agrobacterium larrymoorei TaxID=160699 RepID=A0AAJ2BFD8_9HYPH|nr:S24 family peptidase [Agrobacterium larrymoorei]MDR6102753.1 phage repressor protein C with HTH and peptisase S24 domain [Agrobacterium larrymoorei]